MGIAKMRYVNIYGSQKELWRTLSVIARSENFAPEQNQLINSAVQLGANSYEPLLAKAKGLLKDLGQTEMSEDYTGDVNAYGTKEVDAYLEKFAEEVAARGQRKTELNNELHVYKQAKSLLTHMKGLGANVDDIIHFGYLKVRFGRLPKNSYVRLSYYLQKGFDFTSYFNFIINDYDGDYYWGMYFVPSDKSKEIDDIFASLYFERIWVPEFVKGNPDEALAAIDKKSGEIQKEFDWLVDPATIATAEELAQIKNMASWLAYVNQLYSMQKYATIFNQNFYLDGFVPQDEYDAFYKEMQTVPTVKVKYTDNKKEMPEDPPIRLKNNALVRPYEMYSKMYGLPTYGDIDPTTIVAITYSILYGLMFADIGQGLVLGLIGYFFMYKKMKLPLGQILVRASVFSCLFGVLFSSVFGFEHLLDPLWQKFGLEGRPFNIMAPENVQLILYGSIAIGVVVICCAIFTGIISKVRRGLYGSALFSANGAAGFVFYAAVIGFALDKLVLKAGFSGNLLYIILLIVLPLVLMYFAEPLSQLMQGEKITFEDGIGGFLVTGIFEMFVTMLEYLSNTISFLRVGGFVLAHAGMMMAVMTLAEMFPSAYGVVVVIGNIFVIALEGLIVGIQALRLDYYEVFSHFYDPQGVEFTPLAISKGTIEL